MKNFASKHPFAASLMLFLAVFFGGTILSIILGILLMRDGGDCSAPCDGDAMAAAGIWFVGFTGSLISGVLASLTTFVILILKIKRKEEQGYK